MGASRRVRVTILGVVALALGGVAALALAHLGLGRLTHALLTASLGWVALALVLMGCSLLLRAVSWREVLRAALQDSSPGFAVVVRATMIGILTSALIPGRIGEPTRVVVLARRLPGATATAIALVAGTVFSQTLINLLALGILAVVTFASAGLGWGHLGALEDVLLVPALLVVLVLAGPRLLQLAKRSRRPRVAGLARRLAAALRLARAGLAVFAHPRRGIPAIGAQLGAWALQWLACYTVILALGLQSRASLGCAAAILLAVNVSAVLPATPSNVGVFQAACLVVLAAFGVATGQALAYGIILQAVEVLVAVALGLPALLGEGMSIGEIRSAASSRTGDRNPDTANRI